MARRVPLCNAAFKLAGAMLMPLIDQLVSSCNGLIRHHRVRRSISIPIQYHHILYLPAADHAGGTFC